jgi:hypothetical protein
MIGFQRLAVILLTPVLCLAPQNTWAADTPDVQAVIVVDTSRSFQAGCEAAGTMAQKILSTQYGKHSSILLLATGDSASAYEPRFLASYPLPATSRLVEGQWRVLQNARELPGKIIVDCQRVGKTNISPIFLALKAGLSQLGAYGCGRKTRCLLYVASDGEENFEEDVHRALETGRTAPTGIVGRLDNTNVEVTICGLSETLGQEKESSGRVRSLTAGRNGLRADRLHQVWLQLFSDRSQVSLFDFCVGTDVLRSGVTKQETPRQTAERE